MEGGGAADLKAMRRRVEDEYMAEGFGGLPASPEVRRRSSDGGSWADSDDAGDDQSAGVKRKRSLTSDGSDDVPATGLGARNSSGVRDGPTQRGTAGLAGFSEGVDESDDEEVDEGYDGSAPQQPPPRKFSAVNGDEKQDESIVTGAAFETLPLKVAANESAGGGQTVAERLMAKWGHRTGEGLGARGQGRVEPVGLSTQRGRRGLGLDVGSQVQRDFSATWDFAREAITVEEKVAWLPECGSELPDADEMFGDWMQTGPQKQDITDETNFCAAETVAALLSAKDIFDELADRDLYDARARANPFETIRGGGFQNRAAMKMANLDAVFGWLFSNPKHPSTGDAPWVPNVLTHPHLFYFADVCAGPGGFSEYMLWRRKLTSKGFGFTLRGKDDFKLDKFQAASPDFFEPYYGVDGTGNVTKLENLDGFERLVKSQTPDGVHLVMADGGFCVDGRENIQEILSHRLYLCQCLCALMILRPGGNFVCKVFDLLTPFSVGLVYLVWHAFDSVAIHKPHTSRPANSERYLICKRLNEGRAAAVRAYLARANHAFDELPNGHVVDSLVPLRELQSAGDFFAHVCESNERLAERQIVYLEKYKEFARNANLVDDKQADLRDNCLRAWSVPQPESTAAVSALAQRSSAAQRLALLCPSLRVDELELATAPRPATRARLCFRPENVAGLDWRVAVNSADPARDPPRLVVTCGRQAYRLDGYHDRWEPVSFTYGKRRVSMPKDTVLFAETSFKEQEEGSKQMRTPMLRVFDAACLAGENIEELPLEMRLSAIRKFCAAIDRSQTRADLALVEPAEYFLLSELDARRQRLAVGKLKGEEVIRYSLSAVDGGDTSAPYVLCRGLSFCRSLPDDWITAISRRSKQPYAFAPKTGDSRYPSVICAAYEMKFSAPDKFQPLDCVSGFASTVAKRLTWNIRSSQPKNSPLLCALDGEAAEKADDDPLNCLADLTAIGRLAETPS